MVKKQNKKKKKKINLTTIIGVTAVLFGVGCFLYPNYQEYQNQKEVDKIIEKFDSTFEENDKEAAVSTETETKTEDNAEKDNSIKTTRAYQSLYNKMVAYNEDLYENGQELVDPLSYSVEPFDLSEWSILDKNEPVIGYIEIPDMKNLRMPLFLGASEENLEKGAAVLTETSMPIGGENTNCVIAGHRGWDGKAYFQYIERMHVGSKVYITNPWETLVYECTSTAVAYSDDVDPLLIQEGKDMVTLFTCHPYVVGGGPYRYLVYCERVGTLPRGMYDISDTSNDISVIKTGSEKSTITPTPNPAAEEATEYEKEAGINMLALEDTLRFIIPSAIILFLFIILINRNQKKEKSKKRRKRI